MDAQSYTATEHKLYFARPARSDLQTSDSHSLIGACRILFLNKLVSRMEHAFLPGIFLVIPLRCSLRMELLRGCEFSLHPVRTDL